MISPYYKNCKIIYFLSPNNKIILILGILYNYIGIGIMKTSNPL